MLVVTVCLLKNKRVELPRIEMKRKLDLTVDEIYIIEELLKGKQQKEIELFSENTVSNKLKEARKRNGIEHTDELLIEYKNNK